MIEESEAWPPSRLAKEMHDMIVASLEDNDASADTEVPGPPLTAKGIIARIREWQDRA